MSRFGQRRLTLVSDTGMDVAMLLREIMTPTPMRPGCGPELGWAYPGSPAAVVEKRSRTSSGPDSRCPA